MMRLSDDWVYLLRGVLIPAVTFIVAALLLIGSVWFENKLADDYRLMTADHGTINTEYEALVVSRRILESYHQRYGMLRSQGFVANERRVDLLEVLREAGEEIGLLSLRYSLEPQTAVSLPPEFAQEPVTLYSSVLQLELGLLHELDLLQLFSRVRSRAPGLFSVEQCSLVRQGGDGKPSYSDANVGASCSVKVYSIATADVALEVAAL